jgi:hypothetical protein
MFKISDTLVYNKKGYKILTPDGNEDFIGVNKIFRDKYIHLKFSNGKELRCSEDHPLITIDGVIRAKNLDKKTLIETRDREGCFVISKRLIRKKIDLYDIVNSGKNHCYYGNDIVSHNCNFLGSTNTLISGEKLATLNYKNVINVEYEMKIYEEPIKEALDDETGNLLTREHLYTITVDVSEGKNMDYSAFSVIDISTMPYRQVATYRNNSIPPILFPAVIKYCAEYYNNAHVLIEINNNPQVADILIEDLGYENVLRTFTGNKKPQILSMKGGKGVAQGFKMTPLGKRIACSMLRTLIENNKLIIQDFDTISELTTYSQIGNSYQADEGCNDDLVTSLLVFAWMATQKLFKEMVEFDLRKQLQLEKFDYIEEDQLPAFSVSTGLEIDYFIEDNSLWIPASYPDSYDNLLKKIHNF